MKLPLEIGTRLIWFVHQLANAAGLLWALGQAILLLRGLPPLVWNPTMWASLLIVRWWHITGLHWFMRPCMPCLSHFTCIEAVSIVWPVLFVTPASLRAGVASCWSVSGQAFERCRGTQFLYVPEVFSAAFIDVAEHSHALACKHAAADRLCDLCFGARLQTSILSSALFFEKLLASSVLNSQDMQ